MPIVDSVLAIQEVSRAVMIRMFNFILFVDIRIDLNISFVKEYDDKEVIDSD